MGRTANCLLDHRSQHARHRLFELHPDLHMVEGLPRRLSLVKSLTTEQAHESFSFLEFSATKRTAAHEPLMQSLAVTNEEASRLANKELLADFNAGYWF
jgi:hypothetical protein